MDNLKSIGIAIAFIIGLIVFLTAGYFMVMWVFGPGLAGDLLAIVISVGLMIISLLSLGAALVVCFDVLQSKMSWKSKIMWILFVWSLGVFAAIVYYFVKKAGGISDDFADKLLEKRPSVSGPAIALIFILGIVFLLGGVFLPGMSMFLIIFGTALVFVALYLSKKTSKNEIA